MVFNAGQSGFVFFEALSLVPPYDLSRHCQCDHRNLEEVFDESETLEGICCLTEDGIEPLEARGHCRLLIVPGEASFHAVDCCGSRRMH